MYYYGYYPLFKSPEKEQIVVEKLNLEDEYESYDGILKKNILLPLLGAFGISIAISGVGYGLSMFSQRNIRWLQLFFLLPHLE